jgi:putative ABC transport system permease protein
MYIKEALGIALGSMRAARLRTFLTALGVVIGIAGVIVLLALGNGMRDGFSSAFGNLSKVIIISQASPTTSDVARTRLLREGDVAALQNKALAPDVDSVTPLRSGTAVVRYGPNQFTATVNGTTPAFLQVRNDTIAAGRMFTEQENEDKARVVVISPKIVTYLFGGDATLALRSEISIGRLPFRVVGILNPAGDDQDHFAPIPLNTSRALSGGVNILNGIGVVAMSADRVPAAIQQIYQVMDAQHNIKGGPSFRDYTLSATLDQIKKLDLYVTLLNWLTLTIGGIALFVGTLGVANIMMVTVTHRTTEIGIRKAIGARRSAILKQFLIESVMIAGLGGLVGVVLGVLLTVVGGPYLPRYLPEISAPWVSGWSVLGAFGVSLLIGLLAGTYPARRAARMKPIDAIRST